MKKILITLLFVFSIFAAQRAQAEVSLSFFYDSLQDDGDWFEADDYGYCWQPRGVSDDWSPYTDGYWTYTDAGWTWVSYEPYGWATYHYGRWTKLNRRGWVWVPGYEWGPAWVSWRSDDDYVGWAPLPARAVLSVGITIGRDVDYDYDVGPAYYRFTRCRDFGSPSLRPVLIDRSQNVTIINQTTNITNITYKNNIVYNGGPDYDRMNRRSKRPVERLNLERITRVDNNRDNRFSRRENGRLSVVAPQVAPVEQKIRPQNVKANFGKVEADRGWSGVRDPKLAERTRAKFREEAKGRTRGPVNRNQSVQAALRSEARQKQVASVQPQPALVQPQNRANNTKPVTSADPRNVQRANDGNRDPRNNRGPEVARQNQAEAPTVAKPFRKPENTTVKRNPEQANAPERKDSRNDAAAREKAAAASRQQEIARQNSDRQKQANSGREQQAARQQQQAAAERQSQANRQNQKANAEREAQAYRQRQQASAERESQAYRQRQQAAARQQQESAARQQAARQHSQVRAEQDRSREMRQQAERQQQQRQQQVQQVRQPRDVRSAERQPSRPQVQPQPQSKGRSSDRSSEEDPRKKKKSDGRDDGR